ncbi:type II secretion system protein [Chitiniphilus shinanonensis]|uniref:type II secretion system protein n=1 Tax=Chitiniphilus shinanonensis TaxID=553088 RepID=UPI0030249431
MRGVSCARRGDQRGFAYLFLLFTLLLFALSALLIVEVDATQLQREREEELLFIGSQFRAALRSYHRGALVGGRGEYPHELEDLLRDPRAQVVRRHLRALYRDPMTGKADWGLLRAEGRIVCVHSLSTRAPIKRAGFDLDDAGFKAASSYRDWLFCGPSTPPARSGGDGAPPAGIDATGPTPVQGGTS